MANLETRAEEYAESSGEYEHEVAAQSWQDGYRAALADAAKVVESKCREPWTDIAAAIRRLGK